MKRNIVVIVIFVMCAFVKAQDVMPDTIVVDSTNLAANNVVIDENPLNLTAKDSLFLDYLDTYMSQQREPEYKLYPTKNMYNFLRLNTRTGQIDIVQWSIEDEKRFSYDLDNNIRLKSWQENICGRYMLQPTENTYNFILLDQIDGYCWQVQWSFERKNRFVVRIY